MQNQELTYKYDQLRTNDLGSIEFDFDFGDLMGPSEKPDFEEIRTFLKNEFNEELVRSFLSMELESTKKKELSLDETLEIVKRLDSVGAFGHISLLESISFEPKPYISDYFAKNGVKLVGQKHLEKVLLGLAGQILQKI